MSKTNFKCMFLIDDKLYKKAILREGVNENINIRASIPNSTHLTPIPSSQRMTIGEPVVSMYTPSNESGKISDFVQVDNGQQIKIDSSDKVQQTDIPIASASSDNTDQPKKSENDCEMEIDQSTIEKDDCECNEKDPKASSSHKKQTKDIKRKPLRARKKSSSLKPMTARAKRKMKYEDDNLSDDSDWEELRQRYRRLRDDFDSPPRERHVSEDKQADDNSMTKTSALFDKKENSGPIAKFETLSYICSICKQIFKKRNSLHRHIMNWHSEYFKESGSQNKRKRQNSENRKSKKFKNDGRKKRTMPQNQQRRKIARTEFQCVLCKSFYKTRRSLERHNVSIHGVKRGFKRENSGSESQYVKRLKVNDGPAVTYLNYF